MIKAAVPEAVVTGSVGRRSSFEVTINNKVVFSKLEQGAFPKFESVVEQVAKAYRGEEFGQVTEKAESACVIC